MFGTTPGATREHEFNCTLSEWEVEVFRAAVIEGYFKVYDAEAQASCEFETFPEALRCSHRLPRSLLYAVAATGRWVAVPRSLWNERAELYLEMMNKPSRQVAK